MTSVWKTIKDHLEGGRLSVQTILHYVPSGWIPYLPLEKYLSYFTYLFKRHIQEHLKENFQVNHLKN